MSLLGLLLLLTAFATPLALDYSPLSVAFSTCPSLQPAVTITVTHTLNDVQLVTSTLHSTRTIFSTKAEYLTGSPGKHSVTTYETLSTLDVTKTILERVIVHVPQPYTVVVPLHVTTTIVQDFTSTMTTEMDFSIARTKSLHRLAYQELYQSALTVISGVKVIDTCTAEVILTVTTSRPRDVTSTVGILLTSTATTTLFTTYAFTVTTTFTLGQE